jgi:hypothetical protein
MANTYLTRTFGSAGNRQSWTWSGWIKKSKIYNSTSSSDREVWFGGYTASNDTEWLEFGTQGDAFYFTTSSTASTGNRLMRDPNGWFHAVVTYDGSNIKFYYNNELDFNNTQLSGNRGINVAGVHTIGAVATNQSSRRFNGLMSHVHFVDGAVLAPTVFGETDSVTGEWKIIVEPTVSSYGTNGFFLFKDKHDGTNTVTDSSGNSNNFTVSNGSMTGTEDNPSNVFATGNLLYKPRGTVSYTNGNTTFSTNASNWDTAISTICATAGKYYFEVKINDNDSSKFVVGAIDIVRDSDMVNNLLSNSYLGFRGMGYYGGGTIIGNNGSSNNSNLITGLTVFGTNDIVGCAVDLDNNKMYWHLNGTYIQNGGYTQNPSSGSYGVDFSNNRDGTNAVGMGSSIRDGRATYTNFGNGYFGTTAVSSAGTNASGNGIFEYDVPTGYTALSTKGLNL